MTFKKFLKTAVPANVLLKIQQWNKSDKEGRADLNESASYIVPDTEGGFTEADFAAYFTAKAAPQWGAILSVEAVGDNGNGRCLVQFEDGTTDDQIWVAKPAAGKWVSRFEVPVVNGVRLVPAVKGTGANQVISPDFAYENKTQYRFGRTALLPEVAFKITTSFEAAKTKADFFRMRAEADKLNAVNQQAAIKIVSADLVNSIKTTDQWVEIYKAQLQGEMASI
jgi:hypothetical protein